MNPTREQMKAMLELAVKASEGPWHRSKPTRRGGFTFGENNIYSESGVSVVGWSGFDDSDLPKYQHRANARFIAHARTDFPRILRYALELQEEVERARDDIKVLARMIERSDEDLHILEAPDAT